ncbi:hypothetical protein HK104_002987 [Borealophlyctis nickersoniae]|nr:hypothetical protein HK104_002987 [Borealophlyctis nickersoniae]
MEGQAVAVTTESLAHLANVPWIPLDMPTAEGFNITLYAKNYFTDSSYQFLVWLEEAQGDRLKRKTETHAKGWADTHIAKLLPYIKSFVDEQKPDVKYMAFSEPDEAGQIKILTSTKMKNVTFKWVFECGQLHSDATAPRLAPGDVTYGYITLPSLLMAGEYGRRVNELCALLAKKDREIEECHGTLVQHGIKVRPMVMNFLEGRSDPFDREKFDRKTDRDFRSTPMKLDDAAKVVFCSPQHAKLYKLAMNKICPPADPVISSDGGTDNPAFMEYSTLETYRGTAGITTSSDHTDLASEPPSEAPTLPAGPLASSGVFQTVDPTLNSQAPPSMISKKEAEAALELQRRQEREERLQRYQQEANKKKKRKII